jgi:hypothetical protein
VAGLLHTLGVFMGSSFYPAHATNPYGHWEDLEFLQPNDLFIMQGKISEKQWRDEVSAVIDRRVAMERPWGWKDPRTSRLVRKYLELVPKAHFVRCRRDREAIVNSFLRAYGNHGWTDPVARRVIEVREAALDKELPANRTLNIDFDELRQDRESWVRQIVDFVGLSTVPSHQMQAAVEFIRPPNETRL